MQIYLSLRVSYNLILKSNAKNDYVKEIAELLEHKPLYFIYLCLLLPNGNIRLEVELNTKRFMSLVYSSIYVVHLFM